ncbi:MAG: YigZ family protein [Gracilimonas sp.]|uniref:IMPACT family protein n=1 Tax=Gracilimonas TaxID=649462 RepID=UPI001B2AC21B|nr:YigZ family protein [Gracilimonas sp.]MBO6587268.1 YigZ family protein [Gracilimonas sp.]MBO6614244.1 YigZ family protein [Gracilimonas sp.]
MFSIKNSIESSFRERGSKFLGFLFPAETEDAFSDQLDTLKSKYPDATHHCYGWRMNPAQPKEFSTDDGEPSGTAGLPILNHLKSFEVINAGIVVVRYYGGTKLGKSGLIEAYGLAARQCLEAASLVSIKPVRLFTIRYPYSEENGIQQLISRYELHIRESEYLEHITLKVACPIGSALPFEEELEGREHLNIRFEKGKESYVAG